MDHQGRPPRGGTYINVYLEMNLVSALITGILGVPGVLILLIFKYIL